jgi:predicted outer membrane lipoprotein
LKLKTLIPESKMKTFALSMICSLAVVVCEQQTLFAPHYSDWHGSRHNVVGKAPSENVSNQIRQTSQKNVAATAGSHFRMSEVLLEANDGNGFNRELWFELVNDGYTEDEAFDLIQMKRDPQEGPYIVLKGFNRGLWFELVDDGCTADEAFFLIQMTTDPDDGADIGLNAFTHELWFELVDDGYTEDKAFDLIDMATDIAVNGFSRILWFEFVDSGYTEDEAFDLIDMAMAQNG